MTLSSPYPISVLVYDTDNTTALGSATVTVTDVTKRTTLTGTTNSSGQAVFDLANLTGGYDNADRIQITAVKNAISGDDRHTVNTSGGSYDSTIYSMEIPAQFQTCRIREVLCANTTSGATVKIYNRANDQLTTSFILPATNTVEARYGGSGRLVPGGFVVIRSHSTTGVTIQFN